MPNKYAEKLKKLKGAVVENKNPFERFIATQSPSVNFTFGRTHGLPLGYTAVLYGPPKGGKSVLSHLMIGWLHQTDPEAIAVKFDTEYRSAGQLDEQSLKLYGIDPERLIIIQTNSPSEIFDQTERDIAAQCEAGAPVKLVIVDSVSGIQGRREMENESVEKVTIGDHAQTVQIGLKRILPVIRKHSIALVLVAQVRAEMDMIEQKRGNKFKMQAGFGLQHMAEYFIAVEPNRNAAGRKDAFGNDMVNEDAKDLAGKGEQTGMRIKVKMKDSSMGPKGRTGEFTFDFTKGIINQFEEVFRLGTGRGIIENPKQGYYSYGGQTWHGEASTLKALSKDGPLCLSIVSELIRRDLAGEYEAVDAAAAADEETGS